jgi:hypothetical protein
MFELVLPYNDRFLSIQLPSRTRQSAHIENKELALAPTNYPSELRASDLARFCPRIVTHRVHIAENQALTTAKTFRKRIVPTQTQTQTTKHGPHESSHRLYSSAHLLPSIALKG